MENQRKINPLPIIDELSSIEITQSKLHSIANVLSNMHFLNDHIEESKIGMFIYSYPTHQSIFEVMCDYVIAIGLELETLRGKIEREEIYCE